MFEPVFVPEESWKSAAELSKENHPDGYNLWKNTPKLKIKDGRNGVITFEHNTNHPTNSKATFKWTSHRAPTLENQSDHPIQFLLRHVKTKSFLYWPVVAQEHVQVLGIPCSFVSSARFELYIAESPSEALRLLEETRQASSSSS
ncbi:hypothetical protein PGT21_011172 [Puccinia graminis f. sp. tritici]|uniref:Uncharacterized protein n=1 Tax=Puccinia graminis f. sp. tritici TaxID=56615 RepID=A0A5B0RSA2_PUCGR|nr:hypothetical protein PGT21_011172 [Puccinia graminis f. sp. tritici]KAA1128219.1 hypothetical protein PGTUg99_009462 [Puccinia graminis f. sp. tritici]